MAACAAVEPLSGLGVAQRGPWHLTGTLSLACGMRGTELCHARSIEHAAESQAGALLSIPQTRTSVSLHLPAIPATLINGTVTIIY